jgi:hypothetical protein
MANFLTKLFPRKVTEGKKEMERNKWRLGKFGGWHEF